MSVPPNTTNEVSPPPSQATISADHKNMAVMAHLLSFCGLVFPLANILGPLLVYLFKKDESEFIRLHSVEALNFQISITIYSLIAFVLVFVLIGFVLLPVILIFNIIQIILAAIKASEAKEYRYPLTIRLIS